MHWEEDSPKAPTAAPDLRPLVEVPGAFLALPRSPCPSFLAVVVCSPPDHTPERIAIRDTWARGAQHGKSAVYFLVGERAEDTATAPVGTSFENAALAIQPRPDNPDPLGDSSIILESSLFGDMIWAQFADTIGNLTLKSLLLLQWTRTFCPSVSFVLKADDDVYVDLPGLVSLLEEKQAAMQNGTLGEGEFLLGKLHRGKYAIRNYRLSTHVGRAAFRSSVVPSYLSGAAYVVPGTVVGPLLNRALEIPSLILEDVFLTGIIATDLHLRRLHSACFACCDELPDPCAYRGLLAATVSQPDTLRVVWERLHNSSLCPARSETAIEC
ncbi:beta-1,3-galactosyltransferase 5-like [Haemaphysalis longicornis]